LPLYTLILDYEGGTYISQRRALDPRQAFLEWISSIITDEIAERESIAVAQAFEHREDEVLVPIDALTNVWCVACSNDIGLALLNIIQTED
jgi:hypothetical protein